MQRFRYDDEQRICEVQIDGDSRYARATYQYDALGRRTGKQVWRRHDAGAECTQYAWSGMQMVGEHNESNPDATVQYVYAENSYEPIARVDSYQQDAEVYWYHTEINGLPDRMTDRRGETVWQGSFTAWGQTRQENNGAGRKVPQNLRFQGQYLDRDKSAGSRFEQRLSAGPEGASLMDETSIQVCTITPYGTMTRRVAGLRRLIR